MNNPGSVQHPLAKAAETQVRVIYALLMRETLTRYGDHKLGFLWALIEPMVMVSIMVVFMSSFRASDPGGIPLVVFLVSGFVPFMIFRDTKQRLQQGISSNVALLAFPQVTTFDAIVARGLLEIITIGLVFLLMLGGLMLFGVPVSMDNPLGVLVCCLMLASCGMGLGFALSAVTPLVPSVKQVTSLLFGRPLFLASGIFFVIDSIPSPLREWLLYNPLLHIMELLRSEMFPQYQTTYGSWSYALSWSLGLLSFGMLVHQALRRRAIVGL